MFGRTAITIRWKASINLDHQKIRQSIVGKPCRTHGVGCETMK